MAPVRSLAEAATYLEAITDHDTMAPERRARLREIVHVLRAPDIVTGAEAAELHLGSVLLYPGDPLALPVVRRPDGWFSSLYGDVQRLGRDLKFVVLHRAPEPTGEGLEAVRAEIERGPEGATRRVRLRAARAGAQ